MDRTVLITGATGSIGGKLRAHFGQRGYGLRLLCLNPGGDAGVATADLAQWDEGWAGHFAGVDTVLHMAGEPSQHAAWDSVQRLNMALLLNVLEAAARHRVRRVVFASSNWVMGGYRYGTERLTPELDPRPINPYGHSKLFGECVGRAYHARTGLSFVAFRIGWCQHAPLNRPGPHMDMGSWGQLMWLSDRDLCHAMERAVLAEGVGFAVLNLMSDNPGMRWDLEPTRRTIGYAPQDGHTAVLSEAVRRQEALAARSYAVARELEACVADFEPKPAP